MAGAISAKGILKQPSIQSTPSISDEQKAKADRDRRNLGIALFHANKIQAQKDVEATILTNIETLLEYPSQTPFTSAEASAFVLLLAPFQPSDFDSLVEERTLDGKCGYALCSNVPRSKSMGSNAAWRLRGHGAQDYCSNECLRKALHVKMQLSEVPAWDRELGRDPDIVLPETDRPPTTHATSESRQRWHQSSVNDDELASERGEKARGFRPTQVMADTIVEKKTTSPKPSEPVSPALATPHDSIEGYIPVQATKKVQPTERRTTFASDVVVPRPNIPETDEEASWKALFENMSIR